MNNCDITDDLMKVLGNALINNKSIETLSLASNKIGERDQVTLAVNNLYIQLLLLL
jgi:hypothetical protein